MLAHAETLILPLIDCRIGQQHSTRNPMAIKVGGMLTSLFTLLLKYKEPFAWHRAHHIAGAGRPMKTLGNSLWIDVKTRRADRMNRCIAGTDIGQVITQALAPQLKKLGPANASAANKTCPSPSLRKRS